jgi:hypothetical protein
MRRRGHRCEPLTEVSAKTVTTFILQIEGFCPYARGTLLAEYPWYASS